MVDKGICGEDSLYFLVYIGVMSCHGQTSIRRLRWEMKKLKLSDRGSNGVNI